MQAKSWAVVMGVVSCFVSTHAGASGTWGTITTVGVSGAQYAIVKVSGQVGGATPACHNSNHPGTYSIDLNTVKGRGMLSLVTAAQLAGRNVSATGVGNIQGACFDTGTWGNIEKLDNVSM